MINVLLENNTKEGDYIGVYYFEYDDELYDIIVTHSSKVTTISLSNEIAEKIVK